MKFWTRTGVAISLGAVLWAALVLALRSSSADARAPFTPPLARVESAETLPALDAASRADPWPETPEPTPLAPEPPQDVLTDREGVIDITTPEGMAQSERRQQRRRIDRLRKEDRDPSWSPGAERALYAALVPPAQTRASVADLECASSFCRVDVELQDEEDVDSRILQLITLIPWNTHAFYEPGEPGSRRGSIYFTRPGVNDFGGARQEAIPPR